MGFAQFDVHMHYKEVRPLPDNTGMGELRTQQPVGICLGDYVAVQVDPELCLVSPGSPDLIDRFVGLTCTWCEEAGVHLRALKMW